MQAPSDDETALHTITEAPEGRVDNDDEAASTTTEAAPQQQDSSTVSDCRDTGSAITNLVTKNQAATTEKMMIPPLMAHQHEPGNDDIDAAAVIDRSEQAASETTTPRTMSSLTSAETDLQHVKERGVQEEKPPVSLSSAETALMGEEVGKPREEESKPDLICELAPPPRPEAPLAEQQEAAPFLDLSEVASNSDVRSSLELRKSQSTLEMLRKLTGGGGAAGKSSTNGSVVVDVKSVASSGTAGSFLRNRFKRRKKLCFNPNLTLQSQFMFTFGTVVFVTIAVVIATCLLVSHQAGTDVESITRASLIALFETQVEGRTARYLAESLTPRLIHADAIEILKHAMQDRFAGGRNVTGDEQVPFFDTISQTNRFPVTGPSMPLDWQIQHEVTSDNYQEHVQDRWSWFSERISTASTSYYMQGICDPSESDPMAQTYLPNCTDANNDIATGGVIRPVSTSSETHRKASDLTPLVKALFEYHQEARGILLGFVNEGAGATVVFPHRVLNSKTNYTSPGCDWMRAPNPYNPQQSIGTEEQIARCRPQGTVVNARSTSPLERPWCMRQALSPKKLQVLVLRESFQNGTMVVSRGKAVYDRQFPHAFLGCVIVGSTAKVIDQVLAQSKVTNSSIISVLQWNPKGNIVATTAEKPPNLMVIPTVENITIGVSRGLFTQLISLVDFSSNSTWNPATAKQRYQDSTRIEQDHFVSAYPLPPIPHEYDPNYTPIFLVVVATPLSAPELQKPIKMVQKQVQDNLQQHVLRLSVIVGAAGFLLAILILLLMSHALTAPLKYINQTANDIVGNIGSSSNKDDEKEEVAGDKKKIQTSSSSNKNKEQRRCCAVQPRTELDDVVDEFNQMIQSFSGTSITKPVRIQTMELPNDFLLQKEFRELYSSRLEPGFEYATANTSVTGQNEGLRFLQFGPNVQEPSSARDLQLQVEEVPKQKLRRASPLFLWTLAVIVTPLLLTTIAISAVVLYTLTSELNETVEQSQQAYIAAKLTALGVFSQLRADLLALNLARPLRDLYVLHRYSSWLLFGGLNLTDGVRAAMTSGVEACKTYAPDYESCPYAQANPICGCGGESIDSITCQMQQTLRNHQQTYFVAQSQDVWPSNGDRNSTSFPDLAFSPESTDWYRASSLFPGSDTSGGYTTAYQRHRVAAAVPILQALVHNNPSITASMNFEADGLTAGFSHCWTQHVHAAGVELDNDTSWRPELCPPGKVGYDARCTEWYETGRALYEANNQSNLLHLTIPSVPDYAQIATAPWFHPTTGDHVGQVQVEFDSAKQAISALKAETSESGGFPFLISVNNRSTTTVVAPPGSNASFDIAQLLLPHDYDCESPDCLRHRAQFQAIVNDMQQGSHATARSRAFTRFTAAGHEEELYVAYAPVTAKFYRPVDSSDFARGVIPQETLVYSLGLVETKQGLLQPFAAAQARLQREIHIAIIILTVVICAAVILVVCISNVLTSAITTTVQYLLELIRGINRLSGGEEPPTVDRTSGCKEIIAVANAVETLYQLVRCANANYVAGELEAALNVLKDGLRLFKRLDNNKAIAIASNNLGNVMLALYRALGEGETIMGMTRKEIVVKGTSYYSEAIRLGEAAYEDFYEKTGWSVDCLDFMQHLSDRYFNRAMFLLTVKDKHEKPDEAQELGFRDLQIARDMDVEIGDEGEQGGWNRQGRATKLFNVALSRATGHILLQEMGYPDNWKVDEVLQNAFELVTREAARPASDLFDQVSQAGRLQQIETELMKYLKLKGELKLAAQIGIRMLVEDEYAFSAAQVQAVTALLDYCNDNSKAANASTRMQLESYLLELSQVVEHLGRRCREASLEEMESELVVLKKSTATAVSLSASLTLTPKIAETVRMDVTMEMF